MTTATITVHDDGTPSAYYPPSEQADNGAMDYSVTIKVRDQVGHFCNVCGCACDLNGEGCDCGEPSGDYASVLVGPRITGSITLYRDVANSGMSPCGTPIDGWCSGEIVTWLRTLDARAYKTAVASLAAGVGSEDVDVSL